MSADAPLRSDPPDLLPHVRYALKSAHALPWRDLETGLVVNEEDREVPVSFDDSRLIASAPEWLQALCVEVETLRARVAHEHANAVAVLRKYEETLAEADRLEATVQRLTKIAKYAVHHVDCRSRTEMRTTGDSQCTCGLLAALSGVPQEPT